MEFPYTRQQSLDTLMEDAAHIAADKWGNQAEFTLTLPSKGENIAKIRLAHHIVSVRWNTATGNVAAFYQRMVVIANNTWGPGAKFEIMLRPDGYADIVRVE